MGLDERLKKLEQEAGIRVDETICSCPDALMLAGTPDAKTCDKCGKVIDVGTWKNWHVITPTAETNYFAFALQRDDDYRSETR
jgi:hypothetical protein